MEMDRFGLREPVWTVEAVQPFNVPSLRGELQKQPLIELG